MKFEINAEHEFSKFWEQCSYDPELKPFIRDLWMAIYYSPLQAYLVTEGTFNPRELPL